MKFPDWKRANQSPETNMIDQEEAQAKAMQGECLAQEEQGESKHAEAARKWSQAKDHLESQRIGLARAKAEFESAQRQRDLMVANVARAGEREERARNALQSDLYQSGRDELSNAQRA